MSRLRATLGGLRVDALSVAGIDTCIQLPDFRVAFDVGRCEDSVVLQPTVFLTHAHMDHFSGLAYHAGMRSMQSMRPPTYVVPPDIVEDLEHYFQAVRRLDGGEFPCQITALGPGEEHRLRKDAFVTSVATDHRIPSQGYVLWEQRDKLKPEYQGLPGPEIAAQRRAGAEVTDTRRTPWLAFTGDTLIDVLDREEVLRRARILMIECTFVGDHPTVADARSRGHIHLDEIAERAELLENEHLVLLHFSTRYSLAQIEAEVRRALPEDLFQRTSLSIGLL